MLFLQPKKRTGEDDLISVLQTDVNKLFNRFFHDCTPSTISNSSTSKWKPHVSIKETKTEYVISADLPGVDKKHIQVSYDKNTLTISGERQVEETKDTETTHFSEKFHGFFERSFTIPEELVEKEKIVAQFENGVLTVTIVKKQEIKSEKQEIPVL